MKPIYLGNNSRGKRWRWAAVRRRNVLFLSLFLKFSCFLRSFDFLPGVAGCWLGGLRRFLHGSEAFSLPLVTCLLLAVVAAFNMFITSLFESPFV